MLRMPLDSIEGTDQSEKRQKTDFSEKAKKTKKTSELSRVEWLKNGLSIGLSYSKGDVNEIDSNLALELEDAGYLKVLEVTPEVETTPEADTL